ncbi:MAG: DUF1761 domain-containing protein [Alphaproteobacteria bacterium]|nr:DUF1761 domain-containing protein [Alphaproteobacteria bacterium]
MIYLSVNWLAVALAAAVAWAFGAAWYMVLARPWLAAIGKTPEDIDRADYRPYIWSIVCVLVMAYFVAMLTPLIAGSTTLTNGLLVGAHLWLGFSITGMVLNHRYEGRSWTLTLINGGYLLAVLLIEGAIIGLFG